MDRQYIYGNIDIAQYYLNEFHLLADEESLVLDLCFLPPFRWKAYYMQMIGKNGAYRAHCAYTRYADHLGIESFSQSFDAVEKADVLSHKKGDVICKIVDIDEQFVNTLAEQIRSYQADTDKKDGFCLDGIYAAARLFRNGKITKEVIVTPSDDDPPLIEALKKASEFI